MAALTLLEKVKVNLRISSTSFDDGEITPLIDAAKADLISAGVDSVMVTAGTDALIVRAICVYVKANFGFDNPDADRLTQSYEMLKTHLSIAEDYAQEVT